MTSLANPGAGYTIIPYSAPDERGVSVLDNSKAQGLSEYLTASKAKMMNDALQQQANKSFGKETVQINSRPNKPATLQGPALIQDNYRKFNELFEGDIYGNVHTFETQVLKNDFQQDFMNGIGYWEGVLHLVTMEGMKPKYGFGNRAGDFQMDFMTSDIGKKIENDLTRYYKDVRVNKNKTAKSLFNNAINKIVTGIPEYWREEAKREGRSDLGGGSKKMTTRKYKNIKLSYKRHNKKRTTKNRRRYSRRK
jgi:hypothetical protein